MRFRRRRDPALTLLDELTRLSRDYNAESKKLRRALLALAEILATDSIEEAHDQARLILTGMTVCGRPGDQPETYLGILRALVEPPPSGIGITEKGNPSR